MSNSTLNHAAFKQMPRYCARALQLLKAGGHVHGQAAAQFLAEFSSYYSTLVSSSRSATLSSSWMLPFRQSFRRLWQDEAIEAIRDSLRSARPELRPVFIWLLRDFAQPSCLLGIDEYRHDPSPQVRKHVAKALRRLEAWTLLQEMAQTYPEDVRIQYFATVSTSRHPFAERLKRWAEHVDQSYAVGATGPSRMPYWSRNAIWDGRQPKNVWYIRWILVRIRRWVHGD